MRIGDFEKVSFLKSAILIFFFQIFFCFIPMKTSQSLLISKDGSKFWSSQTWQHFLTQTKHFEGECKMLIISQILWIRDCLDQYCLYNPTGLLVHNDSITFRWSWWRYNVFRRALSKDFWFLYCLMLYVPCRKIFLLPYCNLIQCL